MKSIKLLATTLVASLLLIGCGESAQKKVDQANTNIEQLNAINKSLATKGILLGFSPSLATEKVIPEGLTEAQLTEIRAELNAYISIGKDVLDTTSEDNITFSDSAKLSTLRENAIAYLALLEGYEGREAEKKKKAAAKKKAAQQKAKTQRAQRKEAMRFLDLRSDNQKELTKHNRKHTGVYPFVLGNITRDQLKSTLAEVEIEILEEFLEESEYAAKLLKTRVQLSQDFIDYATAINNFSEAKKTARKDRDLIKPGAERAKEQVKMAKAELARREAARDNLAPIQEGSDSSKGKARSIEGGSDSRSEKIAV